MLKINKDIQIGDTGRTLEMLGETVAETLPVGTIAPYGGSTSQVPQNWLPCDGREVSRLEYAKLFSIIGTRFGAGDSSTTFNLPNLQGKVPVGQDVNDAAFDVLGETGGEKTHTLTVAEIPSHTHELYGALTGETKPITNIGNDWAQTTTSFSTNTYIKNTGGSQAHNNLQPYQVTLYIIKAFDQQLGNLRSESLPVGSEIDFDGEAANIPEGWERVNTSKYIQIFSNGSGISAGNKCTLANSKTWEDFGVFTSLIVEIYKSSTNARTSIVVPYVTLATNDSTNLYAGRRNTNIYSMVGQIDGSNTKLHLIPYNNITTNGIQFDSYSDVITQMWILY